MVIIANGTLMAAVPDFVLSVTEVAVRVTAKSLAGGLVGAVYVTGRPLRLEEGETVPHGAVEQVTLQVTPAKLRSLITVAENCAVALTCTVADAGEIATAIGVGEADDAPPQPR